MGSHLIDGEFQAAAQADGRDLQNWIRRTLDHAAAKVRRPKR